MKLSTQVPTLLHYRAYVEGGEAGSVSPLAWAMSQASGFNKYQLENALAEVNPIVVLYDEDNPLAVRVSADAQEAVYAYCAGVDTLVG